MSEMELLKIAAVSYLNTFPFVYGLKCSGLLRNFDLELEVPSVCAEKFRDGSVDLALVPAGALRDIRQFHYISDFCIGAVGEVKTVLLLSKVPLDRIREVHLDPDSRTSVELVKVLAKHYWKIAPAWTSLREGQSPDGSGIISLVAIGDKTFDIRAGFPYVYDLAEAWIGFTGLPFVFALWISRKELPDEILARFNDALVYGISRKSECLDYFADRLPPGVDCLSYLEHNISYDFDAQKKRGLELFLGYI